MKLQKLSENPAFNPLMIATVLAWGINFVAVKYLYVHVTAPALAFLRWIPMYFAMVAICKFLKIPIGFHGRKDALLVLLHGAMTMGIYMVFFLEAIKLLEPHIGAILMSTSPLMTAFISMAFKQEPWRLSAFTGGFLALSGIAVVVTRGDLGSFHGSPLGVGLMICAALCWALSVVFSKPLMKNRHPLSLVATSLPGALVVLIPYGFTSALATDFSKFEPVTWIALAHISLLAGALGFYGFFLGVTKVGPAKAMLYQFFVPPTALVASILILHVQFYPIQLLGMLMVFGGVYIASAKRTSDQPTISGSPA